MEEGSSHGRDLKGPRHPKNNRNVSNNPQNRTYGTYPVSCRMVEWSQRGDGVTWSSTGQTRGGLQILLITGWALCLKPHIVHQMLGKRPGHQRVSNRL